MTCHMAPVFMVHLLRQEQSTKKLPSDKQGTLKLELKLGSHEPYPIRDMAYTWTPPVCKILAQRS